jgi:hypothetical protein
VNLKLLRLGMKRHKKAKQYRVLHEVVTEVKFQIRIGELRTNH